MEQWLLKELHTSLSQALTQSAISQGKLGLLSEEGTLHFVGGSCSGCNYCLRQIQQKKNRSFENRGCFSNGVDNCLGIPIIARNEVIGILVTERLELPDKARENFRHVIGLAKCYALCQWVKKSSIEQWGEGNAISLVGLSPVFLESLRKMEAFAQSDSPVLVSGESGVGKELLARALYLLSNRRGRPFICVNCGQFHDEHLMVSELFGHKRGSFTGAIENHRGCSKLQTAG